MARLLPQHLTVDHMVARPKGGNVHLHDFCCLVGTPARRWVSVPSSIKYVAIPLAVDVPNLVNFRHRNFCVELALRWR